MAQSIVRDVRFALNPRTGCEIYVDGRYVETCSLTDKAARLAHYGYQAPQAPRHGFTQSGRPIGRKLALRQQGGR